MQPSETTDVATADESSAAGRPRPVTQTKAGAAVAPPVSAASPALPAVEHRAETVAAVEALAAKVAPADPARALTRTGTQLVFDDDPLPPEVPPLGAHGKWYLGVGAVLLVAVWGYFGWTYHSARRDVTAPYVGVDLRDPDQVSALARARYVKIRGVPVPDVQVVHRQEGQPDYTLVPLVSPGWQRSVAVPYMLRVEGAVAAESDIPAVEVPVLRSHLVDVYAWRLEGGVAPEARAEFEKAGVTGLDDTVLVRAVPLADGRPAMRNLAPDLRAAVVESLTILLVAAFLAFMSRLWAFANARQAGG